MKLFLRIIQRIDEFFDYISKVCALISGILIIGVMLMIFAGVFNRALSLWVWLFVEEYSALALIPMSYLVMGYTLRWNKHLKMDLITRIIPVKWKLICGIFAAIFSFVCTAYMVQAAIRWLTYTIERQTVSSGAMQTPLWIISTSILFGLVLFAIDLLLLTINRVINLKDGTAPLLFKEDETPESQLIKGGVECK